MLYKNPIYKRKATVSKRYLTYIAINELSTTVNYKKHKTKNVHKILITCVSSYVYSRI
jgi:CDP-diacylglycerol pyrophosphatase